MIEFKISEDSIYKEAPTHCSCSECNWNGLITECENDWEQESWEYPPYMVHYCPICEDGGMIDEYYNPEWYKKEYY